MYIYVQFVECHLNFKTSYMSFIFVICTYMCFGISEGIYIYTHTLKIYKSDGIV